MTKTRGIPGQRKRAAELIRLAREEFGRLLPGEVKMLLGAAMGEGVDLAASGDETNLKWHPPFRRDIFVGPWWSWGSHRIVRAEFLRWMCSFSGAVQLIDSFGISVRHAHICGRLELDSVIVPFWLGLYNCVVPDGIFAIHARFSALALHGSSVLGLVADGIVVDRDFVLGYEFDSFTKVRMHGAKIQGNLDFTDGSFNGASEGSLSMQGSMVNGTLFFMPSHVVGKVNLTYMQVKYLMDKVSLWPDEIEITDFQYGSIHPDLLGSLRNRLDWLQKHDQTIDQIGKRFNPQPYRQLAQVYRKMGHRFMADVLMFTASQKQANWELEALKETGGGWVYWVRRAWFGAYENLVGYGYRRFLPFMWIAIFIFIGAIVFSGLDVLDVFGPDELYPNVMQPTQGKAVEAAYKGEAWIEGYPAFRPLAYSADAFLPLVNLHQETYWTPSHWAVKRIYLPIHILMGWVITTLAAVSVTGLVRHEKE